MHQPNLNLNICIFLNNEAKFNKIFRSYHFIYRVGEPNSYIFNDNHYHKCTGIHRGYGHKETIQKFRTDFRFVTLDYLVNYYSVILFQSCIYYLFSGLINTPNAKNTPEELARLDEIYSYIKRHHHHHHDDDGSDDDSSSHHHHHHHDDDNNNNNSSSHHHHHHHHDDDDNNNDNGGDNDSSYDSRSHGNI